MDKAPVDKTLEATWSEPLDGFEIRHLVATGEFALVGGNVGPRPEVRVVQVADGRPKLTPFFDLEPPSWWEDGWDSARPVTPLLAVDPSTTPGQLAVTRVEYQGGSYGMVVFAELASAVQVEIPSPTDSDIAYGDPTVIRGDELFTVELAGGTGGALWHYRREDQKWHGEPLELPDEDTALGWSMALSPEGDLLGVDIFDGENHAVAVYQRSVDGPFRLARVIPLAGLANGLEFVGESIAVGLDRPDTHGAGIWVIDPRGQRPTRKIAVPLEDYATSVQALDVSGELGVVTQSDTLWVVDFAAGATTCRLSVPRRDDGRPPRPMAAMMGDRVVAAVGQRVGIFEVSDCR